MAEYINKEDFYMKMIRKYDEVADIVEDIESMPTIDIVHCKDCNWWNRSANDEFGECCENGCTMADWFCADGERKSE